jgi:hypothetical protein
LAEYQRFAEIDFAARTVRGKTTIELDSLTPPEQKRQRNADLFDGIWRQNGWGCAETRSGPGSTLAATAQMRQQLADVCRFLGVTRLVDAGCGVLNWMAEISAMFDFYAGLDVVDEMIVGLDAKLGRRRGHFFALRDITLDDLPLADAVLCRDVMTHLPLADVRAALDRIRVSGCRYLIATTHATGENRAITLGDWHPIDLTAAPFHLPPPFISLPELPGTPKTLGIWQINALPVGALS